jgi:hypothetical protein
VSAATIGSSVLKKIFEPSAERPLKVACRLPLPPAGPVDTSVVVPAERA